MALEDAFLADIVEHPGDDAPRLIYADWLEERGDPASLARAEFIRVQCALAGLADDDPRRWPLEWREQELLRAYGDAWGGPMVGLAGAWEFRRGFVEGVALRPQQFLERAERLFRVAPVRRLQLGLEGQPFGQPDEEYTMLARVAESPYLSRLTALRIHHFFEMTLPVGLAVAESPYVTGLEELALCRMNLGDEGMRVLVGSLPRLRLRRLDLSGTPLSPASVRILAESPHLAGLTTLGLAGTGLTLEHLRVLGASPHLGRLTELDLSGNGLDAGSAAALAGVPLPGRLRALDLGANRLGDTGVRSWGGLPLGQLTRLDLSRNDIRAAGVQTLTGNHSLSRLTRLNLRGNVIGNEGLAALASSPCSACLQTLCLHFNGIGNEGVQALAGSPLLSRLVWLDLIANRVGSAGAAALAAAPRLSALVRLDLQRNDIGPAQQKALRARFGPGVSL
jgi:uncharacterized protein (TIGR02996 family)